MTFVGKADHAVFAPGGRALRDYQMEAVDAVTIAHRTGMLRPAVVLPTGTGKSTVIARLAAETYASQKRTVLLAHRGELLDQLSASVAAVTGQDGLVGMVQADRNEVGAPVVVATVQTLHKPERLRQLQNVGLVVVDEAHRAAADSYQRVLAGLGCFHDVPAAGFTATLSRGDDRKLGDTWEDVVYRKSIRWAIDAGHLVEPHGKSVVIDTMDLDGVKRTGGDFAEGSLGELVAANADAIAEAWQTFAADRKTMVFVPNVEAAEVVTDALVERGARAELVVGATARHHRDEIYARFRDGDLNVLVSVNVLTEGFDEPSVDCVLMARPTSLHHVYVQAAGRGLRPSPGKTDCLILDVVGVSRRFALTTLEDLGTGWSSSAKYTPDGEELDEDDEEALGLAPAVRLRGPEPLEDVDLFAEANAAWQRTHRGTRFIHLREEVVFLWFVGEDADGNGYYRPGTIRAKAPFGPAQPIRPRWGDLTAPLLLEEAKVVAETYAMGQDRSLATRTSSWRQKNQRPSDAQLRYAKRLGVANAEVYNRAALADAMNVVSASHLLDR